MDLNQSRALGGNILGPFQGSLTNLGASGRLQSQIQAIPGQILTFPDPILPTRSNFYGLKWLVQVSHTLYNIYYVQLAPIGGILGPVKSVLAL